MTTKTALLLLLVISLTGNNIYLLKHMSVCTKNNSSSLCFAPSCVCCQSSLSNLYCACDKTAVSQLSIKLLTLQVDLATLIDSL